MLEARRETGLLGWKLLPGCTTRGCGAKWLTADTVRPVTSFVAPLSECDKRAGHLLGVKGWTWLMESRYRERFMALRRQTSGRGLRTSPVCFLGGFGLVVRHVTCKKGKSRSAEAGVVFPPVARSAAKKKPSQISGEGFRVGGTVRISAAAASGTPWDAPARAGRAWPPVPRPCRSGLRECAPHAIRSDPRR